MAARKPKVVVTRKLPDPVEARPEFACRARICGACLDGLGHVTRIA